MPRNFPATAGAFATRSAGDADVFVVKYNPDMTAILAATYLGGAGLDEAFSVAVDNAGSVFVAGDTKSARLPLYSGRVRH